MMDLIRFMLWWVMYRGHLRDIGGAGYWTFMGLFAVVAFAATIHCMYSTVSVVVPVMWKNLECYFFLLRGVGQ